MKLLKVKNPLTKEQTERIEKYFKEEISCNCGVSFETDVRDYEFEIKRLEKDNTIVVETTINCPFCGKVYLRNFVYKDEDTKNIYIYKNYLNAKEQLKWNEQ